MRKTQLLNKRILTGIAGVLLVSLIIGVLVFYPELPGMLWLKRPGNSDSDIKCGINEYEISVEFDPGEKLLYCKQSIKLFNNEDKDLTHIYFHLYPNAFKYEDKPAFPPEEMEEAYPNGFSEGGIDIKSIASNNKEMDYAIKGTSDNLLMVFLNENLRQGDHITINMEYIVALPNCMGRFGYGDRTYKAANWYPIAAVYDQEGWALDPYYTIGDPFYSDIANYRVSIKTPDDYIIAATGMERSRKKDGQYTIWELEAESVRDFAFVAGKFKTASEKIDGIDAISYYFTDDFGLDALSYGADSIKIFSDKFGKYPYKRFSIVECDFFIGGMEYPNLVMIDHSLYSESNQEWLETVVVHETAHQWWYGVVGNDQIDEAWIDEGLTEYSTVLYYGEKYNKEKEEQIYDTIIAGGKYNALQNYIKAAKADEIINKPVYEFEDWIVYDVLVYGKSAMMFHEIRKKLGDRVFFKCLRAYYNKYKYKNVTTEELIDTFSKESEKDLSSEFNKWLYGTEASAND